MNKNRLESVKVTNSKTENLSNQCYDVFPTMLPRLGSWGTGAGQDTETDTNRDGTPRHLYSNTVPLYKNSTVTTNM